jgi:flagellar basal-body rod protein FlgB
MLDKMTNRLDFLGNALLLRAERQRAIASNIANADTPGYAARDFNFAEALRDATGASSGVTSMATGGSVSTLGLRGMGATDARHIPLSTAGAGTGTGMGDGVGPAAHTKLGYTVQTQPSLDNNTVDLDRERASFVNNAVRYEATLRFINGNAKTMLSAIQGQ